MIKNILYKVSIITTVLFSLAVIFFGFSTTAYAAPTVEIWWPTQNAELQGTQPFKGLLQGYSLNQYAMYWQVDGGTPVWMGDSYQDYPHKEASVDLSGWKWKGTGPYVLTFTAKDWNGNVLAQTTRTIYTGPKTVAPAPVPTPAPTPAPSVAPAPVVAPSTSIVGKTLYVDPNTAAAAQVKQWQTSQPANAELIKKIADNSQATWLGGWYSDTQTREKVSSIVTKAKAQNAIPTFVLYNIPQRDCGSYSAGGANNPEGYRAWVNTIANAIGSNRAIVILEPDALAQITCLNSTDRATRLSLLKYAVTTLKAKGAVSLYIDAGHSGWIPADTMANSLKQAGVAEADGFSLNVSNYQHSSENVSYGKNLSAKTGGKHFVIDTSRNGNGSNGEWCNPSGRALGNRPTTTTNDLLVDAYLWIKNPGESDGTCNGGPSAGTWWPSYALGLASAATW